MVVRNIQALRAFAAFLVVAEHIGSPYGFEHHYLSSAHPLLTPFASAGQYGVDLFFIISGCIMMITCGQRFGGRGESAKFLLRRAARIYPPLWLAEIPLLILFLRAPHLINAHSSAPPNLLASFLLLPQQGTPLLLVSWSLVYEIYFYLVFAGALAFDRRYFPWVLGTWAASSAALHAFFAHASNPTLALLGSPLSFEFLLGAGVGFLAIENILVAPRTCFTLGTCLSVGLPLLMTRTGINVPPELHVLMAAPIALLLYGAIGLEQHTKLQAPAWSANLGDASYATYLWHVPILAVLGIGLMRFHLTAAAPHPLIILLAFATITMISLLIYRFVERPMTQRLNSIIKARLS